MPGRPPSSITRRARAVLVACACAAAAAGCSTTRERSDATLPIDGSVILDLAPPARCSAASDCGPGHLCHESACIPDNGPCTRDDDCQGDTFCDCGGPTSDGGGGGGSDGGGDAGDGGAGGPGCAGVCVPWATGARGAWDTTCRQPPFPAAEIVTPELRCTAQTGSETTPLVADLDGDGAPEIVFTDIGWGFHAVHGADCSPYFDEMFGFSEWNASQLAIADLDGDGLPEIVGLDRTARVAVFDHEGRILASAPANYDSTGNTAELGGATLVDLDGKAPPEIVVAGQALRYSGPSSPAIASVWERPVELAYWGSLTIAADLDGDGRPEVIVGTQILSGLDGTDITPPAIAALQGDGAFAAVADFNHDGKPEIVLVQSSEDDRAITVYDWAAGRILFGPRSVPERWGGAPTVADFDGDGRPEIAVAGVTSLTIYDLDCVGSPLPAGCESEGVHWSRPTSDVSSGSCASAAFDLNGDGAAEAIYRDECWLRAFDGATGDVLFAVAVASSTGLELPVVADVDGDGHAEILVTSNGYPGCEGRVDAATGTTWTQGATGLLVLGDPMRRYMPARPLWNEHAYHVTNVLDDLRVPEAETPSWTEWNGYRAAEQGIAGSRAGVPDFTASPAGIVDPGPMDCAARWTLQASICNRGAGVAAKGVRGTFYRSDPRAPPATVLCTAQTSKSLAPGDCQPVSCDWQHPDATHADLWFRADDDGQMGPRRPECRAANDLVALRGASCHGLE